jgi:ribosomal protein S17E
VDMKKYLEFLFEGYRERFKELFENLKKVMM